MTDTLEIFGTEYTGVTGIKATDDNGQIKTYIRPQGNKAITSNGTNIDVIGYSTVSVAVPSSSAAIITDTTDAAGGTIRTITTTDEVHLQTKTITPTSTQQTVLPDTGYDGFRSIIVGASSGGGTPSATAHTIYFEFSDDTNTSITAYYDSTFISDAITATTPTTYNNKTVTLAELDGVAWYNPTDIPLNTELIDFTKCASNTGIDNNGETYTEEWFYTSDYTPILTNMTFSYKTGRWVHFALYDKNKNVISVFDGQRVGTVDENNSNVINGTLSGSQLPVNVAYIRLSSSGNNSSFMSLIRTA